MKKFALTLGGGGARGAVHIGIWMEMERLGLRPQLITGTSIGGMLGALIAFGLSSGELTEFMRKFTISKLYGLPRGKPSLNDNRKLENLLKRTIGRPTFADLSIPLAVVATDLIGRREIILDEGDVLSAILATTAFPVVLPPVVRNNLTLVDGGILNNVPFDVARARGATHVLAVALSNSAPYGTPPEILPPRNLLGFALASIESSPIWQIVSAVSDIITARSVDARHSISRPDILLRPPVGTIGLFDFHRLEEGIEIGRRAFLEAEPQIRTWLEMDEADGVTQLQDRNS